MNSKKRTIPIFVSHRGCPNDCVFCNQRSITGVNEDLSIEEIHRIICEGLKTIPLGVYVEVAFFGGSFTAIELSQEMALLETVKPFIETGQVNSIRISTRPDAIDEENLIRLSHYGVDTIELGVQSMDSLVLQASKRGHGIDCVHSASKLILKNGFNLGLQMMIGLPEDTEAKVLETAKQLVDINPHFVRIYPVLVIKNTELESLFKNKKYLPWSVMDAANVAKEAYIQFIQNNIQVIRIGLQDSEHICKDGDVVAGPYHPAFGEVVYSLVMREIIEKIGVPAFQKDNKIIPIRAPKKFHSMIVGNRKMNRQYFIEKYHSRLVLEDWNCSKWMEVNGQKVELEKYFYLERSY